MEVYEDVRVQFQTETLNEFDEVHVEKTGKKNFIKKDEGKVRYYKQNKLV